MGSCRCYFFTCTKLRHYKICDTLKDVQGTMNSINAGASFDFDFALGPGQEVFPVSYSVKTENRSYKAKAEGVAGG